MFRYYISDPFDGCYRGTNDSKVAQDFADCEDYFVVDTVTGMWLTSDGPVEIKEATGQDDES